MPHDESPMDCELMPSGYSIGPHRNKSTHWLLTEIEYRGLDDNELIKEAVCRLREAEDYFLEREREQDRLHMKIMQLLPWMRKFDGSEIDWSAEAIALAHNDDPDDVLEDFAKYVKALYRCVRVAEEEAGGVLEFLESYGINP